MSLRDPSRRRGRKLWMRMLRRELQAELLRPESKPLEGRGRRS